MAVHWTDSVSALGATTSYEQWINTTTLELWPNGGTAIDVAFILQIRATTTCTVIDLSWNNSWTRSPTCRGHAWVDRDTCRVCYQPCHWSYECPSWSEPATHDPPSSTVNGVSVSDSVTHSYLNIVINGVKMAALLDSGSCKNLMPARLLSDKNWNPVRCKRF